MQKYWRKILGDTLRSLY